MNVKEAWTLIHDGFKEQRALDRKRKQFQTFTKNNLNYTILEDLHTQASKQNPGFYSKLTFPDGTQWEFGVKEKSKRPDENY